MYSLTHLKPDDEKKPGAVTFSGWTMLELLKTAKVLTVERIDNGFEIAGGEDGKQHFAVTREQLATLANELAALANPAS